MATSRRRSALPGFGPALGFTLVYLSLIVLIPLAALVWKTASPRLERVRGDGDVAARARRLSPLLRHRAVGRGRERGARAARRLGAGPLPLPRSRGWSTRSSICPSHCRRPSRASRSPPCSRRTAGSASWLEPLGIQVAFTPLGITVALVFIGLPFVVRSVQPVLEDLDAEFEEAAASLGASRWQTFRRVLLPAVAPGADHRLRAGVRARRRRVRLGGVHLGEHADEDRDRPAPDRHQARAVRRARRHRDRAW